MSTPSFALAAPLGTPLVVAPPRAVAASKPARVPAPPKIDLLRRAAPAAVAIAASRTPPAAALDETLSATGVGAAERRSEGPRGPLTRLLGDRFTIRERLDAGAQGVVYEAVDRKEQRRVALKVCSGEGVADRHRFKREFQAAKRLDHPNLARVFDFIDLREHGLICFTMELVQGVDFITHVRRVATPGRCRADLDRLRRAVRQLAAGLAALHAAGHTHRDIKPSNVLVADDGRVVILDFGLVSRPPRAEWATLYTGELAGTPHYMAPEQLTRGEHGPAIDCYALGVMLYEAITGQMPLDSECLAALLTAKHHQRPRPPSTICEDVPAELEVLVLRLLEREPAARATLADVVAWCGDATDPRATPAARPAAPAPAPNPGALAARRAPLERLMQALRGLKRREPRLVVVQGPAGAGKSALVRHFLGTVRGAISKALVLEGRCDAHEAVPYRAFDGIIDDLARFLVACPEGQRARYLTGGVGALAMIFPILTRVPGIARDTHLDAATPGARERAFAELASLLRAIAGERALLLSIANLHRSDRDSLRLLAAITAAKAPPPMLVVATIRGDVGEPLAVDLGECRTPVDVVEVAMLSAEETIPYARERLAAAGSIDDRLARALARACRGDTRLLARLAPHVAQRPPALSEDDAVIDLGELLAPILKGASSLARRLLDVLAIADGELLGDLLERASGARGKARAALQELRELGLVDVDDDAEGPDGGIVRCVSEAIVVALSAALSSEARATIHRALALAHQGSIHGDEERCVAHFLAAGDTALARDHAAHAGLMAQSALALDQAVRLYTIAVECDQDSTEMRRRLADALAAAGDFERAAIERLRAARGLSGRRRLEHAVIACDHFFLAGRGERGRELADGVLVELALAAPADDLEAERVLVRELACLKGHPLEFRPQVRAQIGGDLLLRVDAPLCIGRHLRETDPTRAAILLVRAAQTALLAGEPGRVIEALALAATVTVGRDAELTARLLARADALAAHARDDRGLALVALARGLVRLHEADAMAALADLAEARELLDRRGHIGPWERRTLLLGTFAAHEALGEIAALRALVEGCAADPAIAGDASLRRWIAVYEGVVFVARGELDRAELRVCAALRGLQGDDPRLVLALVARLAVLCDLGRGVPRKARSRIAEPAGAALRGRVGLDPRLARHHWPALMGRVALACAGLRTRDHQGCCEQAERAIGALEALGEAPAIQGEAALLRAGLAHLRGGRDAARAHLDDADRHFLAAGMSTAQAVVMLRCGDLTQGAAGQVLRARGRQRLRSEGISEPDEWAAAFAPGFGEPARLIRGPLAA